MSTPTPPTDGMHQVQTTVNGCSSVEMLQRDLIPIEEGYGQKTVNARALHTFLESKQQFSHWIQKRIKEYQFIENEDFFSLDKIIKRRKGASLAKDYALTLDMAKELCMVERNKKGRQARKYFIAAEKMWRDSPLEVLADKLTNEMDQVRHEQYQLGAQLTNNRQRLKHLKMVLKETERQLVGQLSLTKKLGI